LKRLRRRGDLRLVEDRRLLPRRAFFTTRSVTSPFEDVAVAGVASMVATNSVLADDADSRNRCEA
jgi:hypothetical protein